MAMGANRPPFQGGSRTVCVVPSLKLLPKKNDQIAARNSLSFLSCLLVVARPGMTLGKATSLDPAGQDWPGKLAPPGGHLRMRNPRGGAWGG
jgi:hypothetical protein